MASSFLDHKTNAFDEKFQTGGDTVDHPGDVPLSTPRMSRFVAKLGRIQAAERAAQKPKKTVSFGPLPTAGAAGNHTPTTPGNPLNGTPVNPPHAGSRLQRSSSFLSQINPYHHPSVEEYTANRSTYLDHIS